jgi:hypothetical protein
MSVANILGANGKIANSFINDDGAGGFVRNPMINNLACAAFDINNANYVRTNVVELETLEPKSPQTFVEVNGDLQMATGKEIRTEEIATNIVSALAGALTLNGTSYSIVGLPDGTASPQGNVIGYNTTTGQLQFQPDGMGPGGVASVIGVAPISSSGGANPNISLNTLGTASTYAYPTSLTTDAYGRISAITGGSAPVASVSAGNNLIITGTATAPVVALRSPLTNTLALGTVSMTGVNGADSITANSSNIILGTTNTTNTMTPGSNTMLYFDSVGALTGRVDTVVEPGRAYTFLGTSSGGTTQSLSTDATSTGILMSHDTITGTDQSMVIQSEGNIRMKGGYNTITNEIICSKGSAGIVMNGSGLTVNSLAGTVNTLTAGVNLLSASTRNEFNAGTTSGTTGNANPNTFITSGVGGSTYPLVRMENTNTTVGSNIGAIAVELYRNKTGATNDIIAGFDFYGKSSTGVKTQFGGIESVITSAGLSNGSLDFYTSVNGVKSQVFRMNGADNENNSFRPLDMNGNNIRSSSTSYDITNIKQIALGSNTGVGNAGQVITSRGTAGATTVWSNPNQTPAIGNLTSGQGIDDTTPNYNFTCGTGPTFTFVPVPNERYRVDFSISLEGPNKDILCFPRITYNGADYFGDIYRNPAGGGGHNPFVSSHITAGGLHYHSINFTDYFTIPFSASTSVGYAVGILTTTGTATVNTARVCATISPCFA